MLSPRWICAAVPLLAGSAWGQAITSELPDKQAGQAAFRVGAQAFKANLFGVAAKSFEEAYAADPRPETAFSIAQAHRRQYYLDRFGWRLVRAAQLYDVYLKALPSGPRAGDAIDRLGEIDNILRELRLRGELEPYTPPERTQIVVGSEIEDARVLVDGRALQLWETLDVAPGKHEIVVEAKGYETARRTVSIAKGRFVPIDVPLREKPGTLRMRTESDAELFVDGRGIGDADGATASLAPGAHFLSVTRRGREVWNQTVVIPRDGEVVVDARLETSGQRRAAQWVGASAGVVAVATGAAFGWAYLARREAEQLDEKRRALEATPEDLERYLELRDDARFRTRVAIGLGIGAGTVGLVALGLYWFDTPTPGESTARVSPVVTSDGAGAMLEASF